MKMALLLLVCSTITFSCIQVDPAPQFAKYSVYSLLSPQDTLVEVFVAKLYSRGLPIPLDSGKFQENADVRIYQDTMMLHLPFNKKTKNYSAKNRGFIQNGKQYELKIRVLHEEFGAKTQVPQAHQPTIQNLRRDGSEIRFDLTWNKLNLLEGLYRIIGNVELDNRHITRFYWGTDEGKIDLRDSDYATQEITLNDANFSVSETAKQASISLYFDTYEPSAYEFHRKIDLIQDRTEFLKHFESPIFINSNLDGNAFGLFGAVNKMEIRKTIQL
jgi:hypothetical protein